MREDNEVRDSLEEHKRKVDNLYAKAKQQDNFVDLWTTYYKKDQLDSLISNARYNDKTARKIKADLFKRICSDNVNILDCGCGTGYYIKEIASITKNNIRFTGIDLSEVALREAQKRLNNLKNLSFLVTAAEDLPFKNECFDVVLCIALLEHVIDPRKSLLEMLRILKNDGYFVLFIHRHFIDPFMIPTLVKGIVRLIRVKSGKGTSNRLHLPLPVVRRAVKDILLKGRRPNLRVIERRAFIYSFEWGIYKKFAPSLVPFLIKIGETINRLSISYYKNMEYWVFKKPNG